MSMMILLLATAVAASSSQQPTPSTTERPGTGMLPSDMKLETATAALERTLREAGLSVEPKRAEPLAIGVDIALSGKQPPRTPPAREPPQQPTPAPGRPVTPPPPPPPTPPRPRPPGPSPFIELETYRKGLEDLRLAIEVKRTTGALSNEDYRQAMAEYKRRIGLYQDAAKLFEKKDER
jgi:hypothetical protein